MVKKKSLHEEMLDFLREVAKGNTPRVDLVAKADELIVKYMVREQTRGRR